MVFDVVIFVSVILVTSAVTVRINAATTGALIAVIIYSNGKVCMMIEHAGAITRKSRKQKERKRGA